MTDDNDEDRPFCPSCHKAYSDHDGLIRTCRDLQRAKGNIVLLRNALIGLVGSSDVTYLNAMEIHIRSIQAPDSDKSATINAIDAIRKTSEVIE
jgi:hypothetical protein